MSKNYTGCSALRGKKSLVFLADLLTKIYNTKEKLSE
jgi:hypothetical protein